ncbi:MAG: OmpA family protein [Pseudomonadota bacterium]
MKRCSQYRSLVVVSAFMVVMSSGCATKGFVEQQLKTLSGEMSKQMLSVESKIENNRTELEKLASDSRSHDSRIDKVAEEASWLKDRVSQQETDMGRLRETAEKTMELAKGARNIVPDLSFSETIYFAFNRWDLSSTAKSQVDVIIKQVQGLKFYMVTLGGHTDSLGTHSYNLNLGKKRVETIYRYMVNHNIPIHSTFVISFGEDKPVAPNKTKGDRARNRRVEIKVYTVSIQ